MSKIDCNDIYNKLDKFVDFEVKPLRNKTTDLELVATINNAFNDTNYYLNPNSEDKILYYELVWKSM